MIRSGLILFSTRTLMDFGQQVGTSLIKTDLVHVDHYSCND